MGRAMLTLRDVMTRDLLTVSPATTLAEVAELFATHRISGAPVLVDGHAVGVISATDMMASAAAMDSSDRFRDATVADAMTYGVHALPPSASLAMAADCMQVAGIHRLLVIEQGRLLGMVTSMDVVGGLAQAQRAAPTGVQGAEPRAQWL